MKIYVSMLCGILLACAAQAAEPAISNVKILQPDGSASVVVSYDLAGAPAVITVEMLTNGVPVAPETMAEITGDANRKVLPASGRTARWRPAKSMRGARLSDLTARVTAYPLSVPPDYAVWDLSADDVPASLRFYPDAESIPGGIGDVRYATTHLVMRKIHSGGVTVRLGTNKDSSNLDRCIPRLVTFSRDYYIGVFELTQGQCRRVWQWQEAPGGSNRGEADRLPMNKLFFDEIRGSQKGRLWPAAGESEIVAHQVDDGSLIAAFREKTDVEIDLPTAAQWEYAYRGGCPRNCFWGMERARTDIPEEYEAVCAYAWTAANCDKVQPVGTRLANGYGLYDMAGNVAESCLNWFTKGALLSDGSDEYDPRGPIEESVLGNPYTYGTRVVAGGAYNMVPDYHASAVFFSSQYCNKTEGALRYDHIGLRLVCDADFLAGENQGKGE